MAKLLRKERRRHAWWLAYNEVGHAPRLGATNPARAYGRTTQIGLAQPTWPSTCWTRT